MSDIENMDFEADFNHWLNSCLTEELPADVEGFCFNLYETVHGFGVELVGTSEFDEENPDWACEEIFEPKQRKLDIPIDYSGSHWEQCLETMIVLVEKYLKSNEAGVTGLKRAKGLGIGFVDGDLQLLARP
tara:strand:+ start:24873 stop:25265 length:393 start_codon:yes stop_codon:yes gene_type:complete